MTSFRGPPADRIKAFPHALGWALLLGAASCVIPLPALACTTDNECPATGHCRRLGDYPQVSPISALMPGQCYSATDTGIVNNSGSPACNDTGVGTQAAPYCQISAALAANKKYIFVGASPTPYAGFTVSSGAVAVLGPTRDAKVTPNPLAQVGQAQLNGASLLLYGLQVTATTALPTVTCRGANGSLNVWNSAISSGDRGIDAIGCANLDVEQTRITSNKSGIVIIGPSAPLPATTFRIVNVAAANGGTSSDPWGVYLGNNTSANGYFAFNTITNYIGGVSCNVSPMVMDNSIIAGNTVLQVFGCSPTSRVITSGVTFTPGPEPKIDASQTCCVNKAIPDASAPKVDYYGTARPQGGGYDIGYDEVPVPYVALNPARLMDTRTGAGNMTVDGVALGTGPIASHSTFTLPVAGRGGLPASGLVAVALNVTAVTPTHVGYLTVWSGSGTAPNASNLNLNPGYTIPNLVVSQVDSSGKVAIYNGGVAGQEVVVDVQGYFPTNTSYVPMLPTRFLDTRSGGITADGQFQTNAPLPSHGTLSLLIGGRSSVPSGVGAAIFNLAAVQPTSVGFVTAWQFGQPQPNAANLNLNAGLTIPNLVISGLGSDKVSLYNGGVDPTELVADMQGWFPTNSGYTTLAPARLLDTRSGGVTIDGQYAGGGAVLHDQALDLPVLGRGGVPTSGVGAVVLNVAAVQPAGVGFVTVYPTGATRPLAANLNLNAGKTIPNLVIAKVGSGGKVSLYNYSGASAATDLVVDVQGWFPPSPP